MMKTLMKTEFGSYLYGTNLPTSDEDYKVVYLPSKRDLLLGKRLKNKMSQTNTSTKNTASDSDVEFVPLHTFVKDFVGGQTYALELAFCPALESKNTDSAFREFVHSLRSNCLTKNVSAMLGYCVGQARKYSTKGDRLVAVRNVLNVLTGFDPLDRLSLARQDLELLNNQYVTFEQDETHTHLRVCDKLFPLSIRVREAVSRLQALESQFGERAKIAARMEGADWKAIMHAVRVSFEAKQLLTAHKLTLPFTGEDKELLLEIRKGEREFSYVTELLGFLVDEVKYLETQSSLPTKDEVKELAEDMLLEFLENNLDG